MTSIHSSMINHVIYPFSDEGKLQSFALKDKIAAFALAIIAGIGIGAAFNGLAGLAAGIAVFYAFTAYKKTQLAAISFQTLTSINQTKVNEEPAKPISQITPKVDVSHSPQPELPVYNHAKNCFDGIDPQVEKYVEHYQNALQPAPQKNINFVANFGDWRSMGYNIEMPLVKKGKEIRLLEEIAVDMPELGNFIFMNIRGNGECGYRTLLLGLLHADCIHRDNIDGIKQTFQMGFDTLISHWKTLFFSTEEMSRFETNLAESFNQLDRMKPLNIEGRMALFQNEEFLKPFLIFVRCLIVSQTKCIESEQPEAQVLKNTDQTNEILEQFKVKAGFDEKEKELLNYALANYSIDTLSSDAELADKHGNESRNLLKNVMKAIVRRAQQADQPLLGQLKDLLDRRDELSNMENILTAPLPEYLELGIDFDEFLKQKALGSADSPRALWALGSDFMALGYALKKNTCCIFRDAFRDHVFHVAKTYRDQPADFYGINLTTQAHYNILIPGKLLH